MEPTIYKGPPKPGQKRREATLTPHTHSSPNQKPMSKAEVIANKRPEFVSARDWGNHSTPADRFPKRMTVGAHQRMAELDFDPLEWSVRIARGEALTKDHPFLEFLGEWVSDHVGLIANQTPVDWERVLASLLEKAKTALTDSWVPLNLRSDHVRDLIQYLYPKLKAVEYSGTVQGHLRIKPLTASEVEIFKRNFDANY